MSPSFTLCLLLPSLDNVPDLKDAHEQQCYKQWGIENLAGPMLVRQHKQVEYENELSNPYHFISRAQEQPAETTQAMAS